MAASLRGLVDRGGMLPKKASENQLLSVEDGIGVVAIVSAQPRATSRAGA